MTPVRLRAAFVRGRPLPVICLACASVALAGCGVSAHKPTPVAAVAADPPPTTAVPAPTATTKSKPRRHGSKRTGSAKPSHSVAGTSTSKTTNASPSTAPSSNPTVVNPANTHPTSAGPKPLACLASAGLNRARTSHEPNVWEANSGLTSETDNNAIVFVDGPYKSKRLANSAVASLNGIELAARGGLYEVSASLSSGLTRQVDAVARCLTGPHGAASKSKSKNYNF